jgi:hypothetical protein
MSWIGLVWIRWANKASGFNLPLFDLFERSDSAF